MFEVKAIQAEHGDALLVSYGRDGDVRHLLIDGGPAGTEVNLISVLESCRTGGRLRLEALVVTHYDLDHINGVIGLLTNKPAWLEITDIWFNGYLHLRNQDILGTSEGDSLSTLIKEWGYPWNLAFGKGAVKQELDKLTLAGGMQICVFSPNEETLSALAEDWSDPRSAPDQSASHRPPDLLGKKDTWPPGSFSKLSGEKFTADRSRPNGSSIALLLEFNGMRALLAADAFASVITSALKRHCPDKPEIHLLKLSHHGSKANTDASLLAALNCRSFLICTNGKIHMHPDHVLIARLLAASSHPDIIFNYDVPHTARWRHPPESWPRFNAVYPAMGEPFVKVDLTAL
jgi:beta-lactamase superfamily II metal-dependent hydrolase